VPVDPAAIQFVGVHMPRVPMDLGAIQSFRFVSGKNLFKRAGWFYTVI